MTAPEHPLARQHPERTHTQGGTRHPESTHTQGGTQHPERPYPEGTRRRPGRVYLVGAGPGDPGLLTMRALELIAQADTILYDRLIPTQALDGARPDAELLFVGKQGDGDSVPQEQTTALLIERARQGQEVVRLKGGDPFVFGRGGEEALALRGAGIEFRVVPGVTAGVAAAAYAGIPVTHRGMSTAVAFVTGHTRDDARDGARDVGRDDARDEARDVGRDDARDVGRDDARDVSRDARDVGRDDAGGGGDRVCREGGGVESAENRNRRPDDDRNPDYGHHLTHVSDSPADHEPELDWGALGAFPGTLVFYMGVSRLERIAGALIEAGRSPQEPVAVVERGTLPDQRTVTGTLATIAEVARVQQVKAPAVTIVGPVAGLAESLEWRPAGPLAGRTIAVTRARKQASELARRLEDLGAVVVQAPTIRTRTIAGPAIDPKPYDLLCLTSPNGVECLFERLDDGTHPPGDARALAGAHIAAIGPGTAHALAEHGVIADVVAERFVAESLVEALAEVDVQRALVARAREAREVLPDALRERGIEVDVIALYETVAEPLSERALAAAAGADYITFTSASTVRHFLRASVGADERPARPQSAAARTESIGLLSASTRIASIGPVTSATLREQGLEPHIEALSHDIDGLVEALLADALTHPR